MKDERLGGAALIGGALAFLVTMALHPTGHDLFAPGGLERGARLAAGVHALAIASLPVTVVGLSALARRAADPHGHREPREPRGMAQLALAAWGLGAVAALIAAIASGFVAPDLIRELLASADGERDRWHALLELQHRVNQACARVFVAASSAAIALLSGGLLRARGPARALAAYGLLLAAATLVALLGGHLRMDVHGFGAVVLGQSAWALGAGVLLLRASSERTPVAS
jgi:hypothetical protein